MSIRYHLRPRNRCLRKKAAFAGSVKLPENTAFGAKAAITAADVAVVVVVAGVRRILYCLVESYAMKA